VLTALERDAEYQFTTHKSRGDSNITFACFHFRMHLQARGVTAVALKANLAISRFI
jgi:hypothetical protein